MKIHLKLVPAAAVVFLSTYIIGCQKAEMSGTATNLQSESKSDANANAVFNSVSNFVSGTTAAYSKKGTTGFKESSGNVSVEGACYTLTITPSDATTFPKTAVLDFGAGCQGPDGIWRKGKIISVITGNWLYIAGSSATTTFNNFYAAGVKVEGKIVTTNTSTGAAYKYHNVITNGKLTNTNGDYILTNADDNVTQTAGESTDDISDNEFEATGWATGKNSESGVIHNWKRTIMTPLLWKASCQWIGKGTASIVGYGLTGIVDFGDGSCDDKATVTINGVVTPFTLP